MMGLRKSTKLRQDSSELRHDQHRKLKVGSPFLIVRYEFNWTHAKSLWKLSFIFVIYCTRCCFHMKSFWSYFNMKSLTYYHPGAFSIVGTGNVCAFYYMLQIRNVILIKGSENGLVSLNSLGINHLLISWFAHVVQKWNCNLEIVLLLIFYTHIW